MNQIKLHFGPHGLDGDAEVWQGRQKKRDWSAAQQHAAGDDGADVELHASKGIGFFAYPWLPSLYVRSNTVRCLS